MQKPVTVPDFVTDGYEYASHFYEAYHAWNNYSADPKNINKTQEFSLGWLEDLSLVGSLVVISTTPKVPRAP